MDILQGLPLRTGGALLSVAIACIPRPHARAVVYGRMPEPGAAASILSGLLDLFFVTPILAFHRNWSGCAFLLTLAVLISPGQGHLFPLFPRLPHQAPGLFAWAENEDAGANMIRAMGVATLFLAPPMLCERNHFRSPSTFIIWSGR